MCLCGVSLGISTACRTRLGSSLSWSVASARLRVFGAVDRGVCLATWTGCGRHLERPPRASVVSAILPLLLSLHPTTRSPTHSTTTMSGLLSSPSLSVPTLTIETSPSELKVRVGRTRSSSIVKVETVGEDSQEEGLDQNLYDNVNAEWVNRKGQCFVPQTEPECLTASSLCLLAVATRSLHRRMDHSPCPHYDWQDCARHNTRNAPRSQLDADEPHLPRSASFCLTHATLALVRSTLTADVVSHVPLGDGHTVPG